MSLIIQQLGKSYGSQKAVNNISFQLNKGEIVGFLGPNGAGKSTTMKMIAGYLRPDGGSISICGQPATISTSETRKMVGYLPEANPLYTEMYVKEYLHFVAGVHELSNPQQAVNAVIQTVGLSPEAHKKTGQLSKGYKQRVGLAAALIHNPEVLILDEPTSGLDPNQIIEIRAVIKALGAQKTILLSSHIMQEVEAICDRVIIINKGNIVADNSLEALQKKSGGLVFVQVSFAEPVAIELLETLPSATVVEGDGQQFKIQTSNADVLKKAILQMSVAHQLNIVSLQNEQSSLEDVFRTLTL